MNRLGLVAKAIATLLGGSAAVVLSTFPDSQTGQLVAGLLGVLGTTALVFAVPNTAREVEPEEGLTLVEFLVGGLILILLLGVFGYYR